MRTIFVRFETGYAGMDSAELMEFDDDTPNEEIDLEVYYAAINHASSYGIEMCDEDCDDEDCELEHPGNSNICGYWVDYVAEKHDMYL